MGGMAAPDSHGDGDLVSPGEFLGDSRDLIAGRGAYVAPNGRSVRASLTGTCRLIPPQSGAPDQVIYSLLSSFRCQEPTVRHRSTFFVVVKKKNRLVCCAEIDGGSSRAQGSRCRSTARFRGYCSCKISYVSFRLLMATVTCPFMRDLFFLFLSLLPCEVNLHCHLFCVQDKVVERSWPNVCPYETDVLKLQL